MNDNELASVLFQVMQDLGDRICKVEREATEQVAWLQTRRDRVRTAYYALSNKLSKKQEKDKKHEQQQQAQRASERQAG